MTSDLREELSALAETQTFSPDPSSWDRGRRVRRRARVVRGAAALAAVALLAGAGAIAVRPDAVGPAGTIEPEGAIPSIIDTTNVPFETTLPTGRASVAFFASGAITVIGAENGRYHQFGPDDPALAPSPEPVLALSPDGRRLAWTTADRIAIADLESGEVLQFAHNGGRGATVTALQWRPDSMQLSWNGRDEQGAAVGIIDVTGPSELQNVAGRYGTRGLMSPNSGVIALPSRGEVSAAPFLVAAAQGLVGRRLDRPLPTDLYPDGAMVRPLGWADEDLMVALIDPPQSDIVERPRLAIFTSPDQPESDWIYQEFLPRLPPVDSLSIAVDLIPDLTGDPGQELTHDFSAGPGDDGTGGLPYALAGVLAVLLGLAFIGSMGRRA